MTDILLVCYCLNGKEHLILIFFNILNIFDTVSKFLEVKFKFMPQWPEIAAYHREMPLLLANCDALCGRYFKS